MCEICVNNKKLKEVVFTQNDSGDEVSYCMDCYNHELSNTKYFMCECCFEFESRENLCKNEDGDYLCAFCYYHEQAEEKANEAHLQSLRETRMI